jgi:hypothetical protein
MFVKNKKSGGIETMRHGPATDAVEAGTHEFVNLGEDGKPVSEAGKSAKKAEATK